MFYDYTNKNIIVTSNEYAEHDTDITWWIRQGEKLLRSRGLPNIIHRCIIEDHVLTPASAGYTTYQLYQ